MLPPALFVFFGRLGESFELLFGPPCLDRDEQLAFLPPDMAGEGLPQRPEPFGARIALPNRSEVGLKFLMFRVEPRPFFWGGDLGEQQLLQIEMALEVALPSFLKITERGDSLARFRFGQLEGLASQDQPVVVVSRKRL